MNRTASVALLIITFLLLSTAPCLAAPPGYEVPPNLEQWKGWVLHGNESRLCPTHYDNGESYQCAWPSRLQLTVEKNGGTFSQDWLVFAKTWVPLPGSTGVWPHAVNVDGKVAPVVGRENVPTIYLTPGAHRVEGSFSWKELPEIMTVPPESGLVSLRINGTSVPFPFIESNGSLWLRKREGGERQEDRVNCRMFRLLNDTVPMQVTTLLRIDISGQPREIKLAAALLDKAIPLGIGSPLPSRLTPEGELVIQGRPGRWEVEILSRLEGPVNRLSPPSATDTQEVWSFQSQNHLRMTKIEGVSPVDPKQTEVPPEWQHYPTFIMPPHGEMIFKEIRRGDPSPAPDQLRLARTWWLDFDGSGFTMRDTLTGTLSRQWYMAMNSPTKLGRVSVDGVDQLITSHGKEQKPGVELRKGHLELVGESRYEASTFTVPAVGWDHDFQSLSGVLNLPPGWKLLAAQGVDAASGTWIERWSLLDLFIVLVISLAVAKLWNKRWGLLALFAVGLTYHEPGAPQLVWLNLLAALALCRFLPEGWAKKLATLWRWGSVLFLLILVIPFIVQEVRWGVYPQLEPHDTQYGLEGAARKRAVLYESAVQEAPPAAELATDRSRASLPLQVRKKEVSYEQKVPFTQDPHALIQTGPGLPTWRWRTIALQWNGPVARDQKMYLWLLSPLVNLVLAFLRVALMAVLIFHLLPFQGWSLSGGNVSGVVLVVLLAVAPARALAREDPGYPPEPLLKKLQERLLEKPECLPRCADCPRMLLAATGESIRILFMVHAGVSTAVPLPCSLKFWMPEQVLLDERPAQGLMKDGEAILWGYVPEGVHTLTLLGRAPSAQSFTIPLSLKPQKVEVELKGWTALGVQEDGQAETSIQLTRAEEHTVEGITLSETKIAPFFSLERVLRLGLTWQVHTTVRRVTNPDTPVVVSIPLLEGESVTTAGIPVEHGQALISLRAKATEAVWTSSLKEAPQVRLKAPQDVPWTEIWTLDASPIWHCELAGISVIYHQDQEGYWMPRWQPWPGESVTINVSRPPAVQGEVLTIEGVTLEMTPGERYTKEALGLTIRSSKGGQHRVTLPRAADLLQVTIDGQSQPIKQEENEVVFPLQPGLQAISLEWHQPGPSSLLTRSPEVTIGSKAVNADIVFVMPAKRWILWTGGPHLGPAVLFWSYVVVIILAAVALGRIDWTPLRTRHWLLLGLGLTQVHPIMAITIVGWLLALGMRKRNPAADRRSFFNLSQLLLFLLTASALVCLYLAVQSGLLGIPDMQISGNGSSNLRLHWTQDRIGSALPQPWVLSLPLYAFRVLMLLWALWLAYSLLNWLRWGWHCFSEGGLWKKKVKAGKKGAPSAPLPSPR